MLERNIAQKSDGYSLVEVLIAASLGAIIVMTAQQLLQWQKGAQHSSVSKARFMLSGQAVAETFLSSLSNSVVADVQNPERGCYVFPTQNGGSVGFRSASLAALLFYAQMLEAQQAHQWQVLSEQLAADFNQQKVLYESSQQ